MDSQDLIKHCYEFIKAIETPEHGIEVRGNADPDGDVGTPLQYDDEKKVLRVSLNFEWPYDQHCPNCGELVAHDSRHWKNWFSCDRQVA